MQGLYSYIKSLDLWRNKGSAISSLSFRNRPLALAFVYRWRFFSSLIGRIWPPFIHLKCCALICQGIIILLTTFCLAFFVKHQEKVKKIRQKHKKSCEICLYGRRVAKWHWRARITPVMILVQTRSRSVDKGGLKRVSASRWVPSATSIFSLKVIESTNKYIMKLKAIWTTSAKYQVVQRARSSLPKKTIWLLSTLLIEFNLETLKNKIKTCTSQIQARPITPKNNPSRFHPF